MEENVILRKILHKTIDDNIKDDVINKWTNLEENKQTILDTSATTTHFRTFIVREYCGNLKFELHHIEKPTLKATIFNDV